MDILKESHDKRLGQIDNNLKDLQHRLKDQLKYYDKRIKERDQKVTQLRAVIQEDNETKKELNMLRKADQEENYLRTMNIHNIYKQKLLEKIIEKRERADKIKEQQMRIAELCRTVRGPPPAVTVRQSVSPVKVDAKAGDQK